jgi:hypothetical protein
MDERIGDLLAWDRTVHREQPPQKNLSTGVARTEESKENDLPLDVHVGPHIIQGEIPVNDITLPNLPRVGNFIARRAGPDF